MSERTWRAAVKRYRESDEAATRAAHEHFPIGSRVIWHHGDNLRRGEVTRRGGLGFHRCRFEVLSDSGSRQWVYVERLSRETAS